MREVIFNDGLVTVEVNAWGGVVRFHRISKVPREVSLITLDEEELDAICEWWWAKKKSKELKRKAERLNPKI